ncbi:MAG: sensor domain-containing diguanylate cyclase [Candidatus Omnitrophica bacterium]|nr:sensor domain-containing diguanylate cyclase [Candidatus Omnitrophota bacterium]
MEELRLQEELRKTRQELLLLYEIGNLIRTTLLLDEVIYLILSAVTSHEGLGYNRAILFLMDETGTQIEGKMGIGPTHPEVSPVVWKMIEENKITLEGLLDVYHKADKKIDVELNRIVAQVKIPIEKSYGVLPKAIIHDQPQLISKEDVDHELCHLGLRGLGISQFAVVPLRGKNHVIGALLVDNITTKKELHDADVRRIMMLADHAGLALENAKIFNDVVITSQQDSLTKLWNHGHFQRLLEDQVKDAKIAQKPLSVLVFDVDDFKTYNDTYGHQAGDKALEYLSNLAKTVIRRMDYLARYGGEEFAAILPDTTKAEAMKLAERLKNVIGTQTSREGKTPCRITVSIGVASFPEDAEDKDKLIFCADGALYESKRNGKNQVRVYRKPLPVPGIKTA